MTCCAYECSAVSDRPVFVITIVGEPVACANWHQAMPKAEGITQEFQDVTAKGEALVAQHLHPAAEGQVGGDEDRVMAAH